MKNRLAGYNTRLWCIYSLLALTVILPLLKPGFILTLDMVFTPHLRAPIGVSNSCLFLELLHLVNFIIPSDVIEKLILFSILILSGVGAHRLASCPYDKKITSFNREVGYYFAGILYTINPFTYDRFMSGQYDVLLGYALLPWFTRSLIVLLKKPGPTDLIRVTLLVIVISVVSIHTLGIAIILSVLALGIELYNRREDFDWLKAIGKYSLLGIVLFFIASSYWLIPLLESKGNTATEIGSFSASDQSAFATTGGSVIGKLGNVIRLQGFWAENTGQYILPQNDVDAWGILALIIWIVVITGGVSYWNTKQYLYVSLFTLCGLVATILSIGALNNLLASNIPLFAGYREPEKFVELITLSYAILSAQGLNALLTYVDKRWDGKILNFSCVILLLVPIAWTYPMFWGFDSQLVPVNYPAEWYVVNDELDKTPGKFKVLFLPWHLYMYFGFAGRLIASPAPQFFDKQTYVNNNPEFNMASVLPNTTESSLSTVLNIKDKNDLANKLNKYQIKYVILDQEVDFEKYNYLNYIPGLRLVSKSPTLNLYLNTNYGG